MRSCPAVSGRDCSALERVRSLAASGRSQTKSGSSVTAPRSLPCGVSSAGSACATPAICSSSSAPLGLDLAPARRPASASSRPPGRRAAPLCLLLGLLGLAPVVRGSLHVCGTNDQLAVLGGWIEVAAAKCSSSSPRGSLRWRWRWLRLRMTRWCPAARSGCTQHARERGTGDEDHARERRNTTRMFTPTSCTSRWLSS